MKEINIGLIGLGTIGSGVVKYINENQQLIGKKSGLKIIIKKAFDRNPHQIKLVDPEARTSRIEDIINDPEIEIFVELIGGYDAARHFILKALRKGKHVVTANKAVLAKYGYEIFEEARKNNRNIGFEASVCGGIPIIKILRSNLDRIKSIKGILNGTTNYILSKMTYDGLEYKNALREAQETGFAEADPTFDVEGHDATQKLALVVSLAFGVMVDYEKIYREGITHITKKDIEYARELGFSIKLLAMANMNEGLELSVCPVMIPQEHLLSSVRNEFNALYIDGKWFGPQLFTGRGAGQRPTADAVVKDIVDIAKNTNTLDLPNFNEKINIKNPEDIESKYYFCFSALNKPSVLSKISGILGKNGINIVSAIQKGSNEIGSVVDLVMTTSKAKHSAVQKALEEIDKLDVAGSKTRSIRIEEE